VKILVQKYTFDKVAKTVTFTDYTTIRLDSILLITNVTDNIIIYNFADNPSKGGTVTGNVLTLLYDTSSMANSDKLQIFYDDANASQLVSSVPNQSDEMEGLISFLGSMVSSGQMALRVSQVAGVTQAVTLTSTTLTGYGGYPTYEMAKTANALAVADVNLKNVTA
jgi:hypothetical protein